MTFIDRLFKDIEDEIREYNSAVSKALREVMEDCKEWERENL